MFLSYVGVIILQYFDIFARMADFFGLFADFSAFLWSNHTPQFVFFPIYNDSPPPPKKKLSPHLHVCRLHVVLRNPAFLPGGAADTRYGTRYPIRAYALLMICNECVDRLRASGFRDRGRSGGGRRARIGQGGGADTGRVGAMSSWCRRGVAQTASRYVVSVADTGRVGALSLRIRAVSMWCRLGVVPERHYVGSG